MNAELSQATLSIPILERESPNRDPRVAPTLFEQVEPLPVIESQAVKLEQPVEKANLAPTNAKRLRQRRVFLLSFGVSLVLGAAWIVKSEMGSGTPGLIPEVSGTIATQEIGPKTTVEPAGTKNPCSATDPEVASPPPKPSNPIGKPAVEPVAQVRLKVLADPREGRVVVGEQSVGVSEQLILPVGVHRFQFEGDGWTVTCEVSIGTDVQKIKFVKLGGEGKCVLLP